MKSLINKNKIYQLIRFGFVGFINTMIDLAVLNLLVYLFSVTDPLVFTICKAVSFAIAVVNSYFMNKYFTFSNRKTTNKSFYLFVIISLVSLFVNMLISGLTFYLFNTYAGSFSVNVIATISGIIGAIFSMFINYISYTYFVFK